MRPDAPTRECPCPHGHPLCACHEGLSGVALLRRSNRLSSLAGWPGKLDPDAVAAHRAAVRRASKPRIPLGTPAPVAVPPADCVPCRAAAEARASTLPRGDAR